MVKFYRAALARGVQPIVGVDLHIKENSDPQGPSRLTLLCQNLAGYRNLTRLVSRAWLEGQVKGVPLIEREWLTRASTSGLIALSGAQAGDVGRALLQGRSEQARQALQAWRDLFDDRYYLEVQRIGAAGEELYVPAALQPRLNARRGAGGHQRCALSVAGRFRGARGARVHSRGHLARRPGATAPLQSAAVPAIARADGGLVSGGARGPGQQRRDRATLQPGAASGRGAASGVPGAARARPRRQYPQDGRRARLAAARGRRDGRCAECAALSTSGLRRNWR